MRRIAALAVGALLVGSVGIAEAVTLVAPPEGAETGSTPTFSWQLAPDEQNVLIEWTQNPALGPGGEFANHRTKRGDHLADGNQTRFTVPRSWALTAGRWWWRVEARAPDYTSRPSAVRSFIVRDERPGLAKVDFDYLGCFRRVYLTFQHFDNSEARARSTAEFFARRRGGRRLARVSLGRTSKPGSGGAKEAETFRKPRRLRLGRTYYARLVLRDSAGQVARSKRSRIRLARCSRRR